MMRLARLAAIGLLLMTGMTGMALTAGVAVAQQAQPAPDPAAQRCGGLFCDVYFGLNPNAKPGATSLPCHDFVCGAFGGRTPDEPPAVQQAAAAPEPEAAKPHKPKKKRVAKVAAKASPSPAATATPAAKPAETAAQ